MPPEAKLIWQRNLKTRGSWMGYKKGFVMQKKIHEKKIDGMIELLMDEISLTRLTESTVL